MLLVVFNCVCMCSPSVLRCVVHAVHRLDFLCYFVQFPSHPPPFTCCSAVVCFLCFLQAVLHFWLYVIGILLCFSFCFCFCFFFVQGFFLACFGFFALCGGFFPLAGFFSPGSSGCLNKIVFLCFLGLVLYYVVVVVVVYTTGVHMDTFCQL